jgi:hypothetical protein
VAIFSNNQIGVVDMSMSEWRYATELANSPEIVNGFIVNKNQKAGQLKQLHKYTKTKDSPGIYYWRQVA